MSHISFLGFNFCTETRIAYLLNLEYNNLAKKDTVKLLFFTEINDLFGF